MFSRGFKSRNTCSRLEQRVHFLISSMFSRRVNTRRRAISPCHWYNAAMDPSDIHRLIDQAFAALRDGDYVRAVAIGDQLTAAAPANTTARAIRAQALLGANAPEESFTEARHAVDLDPKDEYAHRLLALTAWRNGRLSLAQESFQQAIKLSGRKPALLSEYAWFMASERGPKLGEQAAKDAVEADAESSTAWAALGLARHRLHRRQEAETDLQRALQLDPSDIYAQSAMVAILQEQRDDAKAKALASMLEEHVGAEDLAASVRDDAKQRQIARMLLERKVDLEDLVSEPRRYYWVWILGAATLLAMLLSIVSPLYAPVIIVLAIVLLLALWRWYE